MAIPTAPSTFNAATRNDQLGVLVEATLNTSGVINDLALNILWQFYRVLAATEITGIANGSFGREIYIYNFTGATLTIRHQNSGSIAANRFLLVSGADLVIPIEGICKFVYHRANRWLLASKNF